MAELLARNTHRHVVLDYSGAQDCETLIVNLSGAAASGDHLWTVSDEGRNLECLIAQGDGFKLQRQYKLDKLFKGFARGKECDLEAIAIERDRLWLCGSHCQVRLEPEAPETLNPGIRARLSRNLLGAIKLERDGSAPAGPGTALTAEGKGSLRHALSKDAYLKRFLKVPSKENGLDIEGCAALPGKLLLGLRGPVLDNLAVVLELAVKGGKPDLRRKPKRHFLDLGGLGIRGLARHGAALLVLGGPVTAAPGRFRIHRWKPGAPDRLQKPAIVHDFPDTPEKPEGLCLLRRAGKAGVLIVYDSPDASRIKDTRYLADWFAFAPDWKSSLAPRNQGKGR